MVVPRGITTAATRANMVIEERHRAMPKRNDSPSYTAATAASFHKKKKTSSEPQTTLSRSSLKELAARMKEALAVREQEQKLAQQRHAYQPPPVAAAGQTADDSNGKLNHPASYRERVKAADDALDSLKAQLKTKITAVTSSAAVCTTETREPKIIPSMARSSSVGSGDQRDDVEAEERTRDKHNQEASSARNASTRASPTTSKRDTTKATPTTQSKIHNSLQSYRNKDQELRLKAEEKVTKLYAKIGDMDRKLVSAEEVARKERNLQRISAKKVAKLQKSERRLTQQLKQAQEAKTQAETKLLAMMEKMSRVDDNLTSTSQRLSQALQRHAQDVEEKDRQAAEIKTLRLQLHEAEKKISKSLKGLDKARVENENSTQCIQMLRQRLEEKEQEHVANTKKQQDTEQMYRQELSKLQKTDRNIAVLQQRLEEKRHQIERLQQKQRTEQLSLTTNVLQNKYLMSSLEQAKDEVRKESTRRLKAEDELRRLRASYAMASSVASTNGLTTINCPGGIRVANHKMVDGKQAGLSKRSNTITTSEESWTSHSRTDAHPKTREDSLAESASEVLSEMEELFSQQGSPRHEALVSSLDNTTTQQRHFMEMKAETQVSVTMDNIKGGETASIRESPGILSKEVEPTGQIEAASYSSKTTTLSSDRKKPTLHVDTMLPPQGLAPLEQANESISQQSVKGVVAERKEVEKTNVQFDISCIRPDDSSKNKASKTSTMKRRALELLSPSRDVPVHIRDMYQRVGFYKDRKNRNQYRPVLCLAAYSMPPGPAQDAVMRSSDEKVGVYLYGCSVVESAYQSIKWFRFIPYETGVGRGHLDLPQHIDAKKRNKTSLSAADHDLCHGLVVIQREATKSRSERIHPCEPHQQQSVESAGVPTKSPTKQDTVAKKSVHLKKNTERETGSSFDQEEPCDGLKTTKQISSPGLDMLAGRVELHDTARTETKPDVAEQLVARNFEAVAAAILKESSLITNASQVMNTFKQCLVPECVDTTGLLDIPTGLLEGSLHKPTVKEVMEMTKNISDTSSSDEQKLLSFSKTHQNFSAALQKLARTKISVVNTSSSTPSKPQQEYIKSERERDIPEFIVGVGTDSVSEMGEYYFEIAPKPYDVDSGYCVDQLQQILGRDYQDNIERLRCAQRKPPCVEETSCFPSFPSDESGPKNLCL